MKRIIGMTLAFLMATTVVTPGFAEEKAKLTKSNFKVLTLEMARELAAATVEGNQAYLNKLEAIKKEKDKPKLGGMGSDENEYDAKKGLDEYKESLYDLKKSKRSQVLEDYSNIITQSTQLSKTKNLLETAELGLVARELEFKQGRITSDLLTQSRVAVQQAKTGLKNAQTSVDLAYSKLNTLLNFQEDSRYELDLTEIMAVVGKGNEVFLVPLNLDSEKWKEFKQLKDMQKAIDDKEKKYNKEKFQFDMDEAAKKEAEFKWSINDDKESLKEKREDLFRSMTQSYSLGVNQLEDLANNYRALELAKLRYELDQKSFNLGQISKLQLLQKEGVYLDAKTLYEGQVISLYKAIDSYNKAYKPDDYKSGGNNQ